MISRLLLLLGLRRLTATDLLGAGPSLDDRYEQARGLVAGSWTGTDQAAYDEVARGMR